MKIKRGTRKNQKTRNVPNRRKTTRRAEKGRPPISYLLEPHPELGIPECEQIVRGYASSS
jgi:hypothetical protein